MQAPAAAATWSNMWQLHGSRQQVAGKAAAGRQLLAAAAAAAAVAVAVRIERERERGSSPSSSPFKMY